MSVRPLLKRPLSKKKEKIALLFVINDYNFFLFLFLSSSIQEWCFIVVTSSVIHFPGVEYLCCVT